MKTFTARHQAMLTDLVIHGKKKVDIAKKYDVSDDSFSRTTKSSSWRAHETELRKELYDLQITKIRSLMTKAVKVFEKAMNHEKVEVRMHAAANILDRGGIPKGLIIEDKTPRGPEIMQETFRDIIKRKKEIFFQLGIKEEVFYESVEKKSDIEMLEDGSS